MFRDNGFFDRLNRFLKCAPTDPPIDWVLTGTYIADADVININSAALAIGKTDCDLGSFEIEKSTNAPLPIQSDNLFVEFIPYHNNIIKNAWAGLHIVPLSTARHSILVEKMGAFSDEMNAWPKGFMAIHYREIKNEIVVGVAGLIWGMEEAGCLIDLSSFTVPGMESRVHNWEEALNDALHFNWWLFNLMHSTFAMVEQKERSIKCIRPKYWEI